eukprot:7380726-Pyramimonas_sp.AAC.1
MAKQKIGQGYDAYAFQETHVGRSNLDSVECELVKLGCKACFTAARPRSRSERGTCGGTAVVMRGHLRTS